MEGESEVKEEEEETKEGRGRKMGCSEKCVYGGGCVCAIQVEVEEGNETEAMEWSFRVDGAVV